MKVLYLSKVIRFPNELGEATIEKAIKKSNGNTDNRDMYGRDAEYYRKLNLPVPEHLLESENEVPEISENGKIFLPVEQLDFEFLDFILPLKHFFSAEDTLELSCIVKDTLGKKHHVAQMAEEIYSYIVFINRPWYVKIADYIRFYWNKIFGKKELEININLETKEITD